MSDGDPAQFVAKKQVIFGKDTSAGVGNYFPERAGYRE